MKKKILKGKMKNTGKEKDKLKMIYLINYIIYDQEKKIRFQNIIM